MPDQSRLTARERARDHRPVEGEGRFSPLQPAWKSGRACEPSFQYIVIVMP